MDFKKIHLVINPAAGQPQAILNTVNTVFHEQDVDWDISITSQDGDGKRLAQAAIEKGADLVVAYGGDGTVKDVVNGLMGTDIPLGILHGGTGNAMAYNLGIPHDLKTAAQLLLEGHQLRPLDLGEVVCDSAPDKKGYFILRSSIGLQNKLLDAASREMKDRFGNLAYIMAAIQTLREPELVTFRLSVDGEQITQDGMVCFIANAVTVGGANSFDFAPEVSPNDGLLNIFVIDGQFANIMNMMRSNLTAKLDEFPGHWAGREFRIETDPIQEVSIDGEKFGETPISIKVIPQAVKILVPAEKVDTAENKEGESA